MPASSMQLRAGSNEFMAKFSLNAHFGNADELQECQMGINCATQGQTKCGPPPPRRIASRHQFGRCDAVPCHRGSGFRAPRLNGHAAETACLLSFFTAFIPALLAALRSAATEFCPPTTADVEALSYDAALSYHACGAIACPAAALLSHYDFGCSLVT